VDAALEDSHVSRSSVIVPGLLKREWKADIAAGN
jgi:hypothetical protein